MEGGRGPVLLRLKPEGQKAYEALRYLAESLDWGEGEEQPPWGKIRLQLLEILNQ